MLQSYDPDDCCKIGDAIASGQLDDVDQWVCPDCGMPWKPILVDGTVRHWRPTPVIVVL